MGNIRIGNGHSPADAASAASVEFDKIKTRYILILNLVKHADAVFDAVRGKVTVVERRRTFAAGRCPTYAYHSRLGSMRGIFAAFHCVKQLKISVPNGNDAVDVVFVPSKAVFDITDFGCAGRYEKYAYRAQYLALHDDDRYWTGERVLAAQDTFRVLLAIEDGAVAGYLCRDLDRRKQRHDIFRKIRIVHAYHSCYYGTRGTYHGFDYILAVQIHPRVRGDHFRGAGNFENMVESDGVQAFYYIVGA